MYANLYTDRMDVLKYLPMENCLKCGYTCDRFAEELKKGSVTVDDCPFLDERYKEYLKFVLNAEDVLPKVPIVQSTVKTRVGLIPGDRNSPVLVTANYPYTQAVIGEVLAKANVSCHILIIDTEGHSVDMAVYLGLFTGDRVRRAIDEENNLEELVGRKVLVIPGLAKKYRDEIERETGWKVLIGPVCAAEIPVYLLKEGIL